MLYVFFAMIKKKKVSKPARKLWVFYLVTRAGLSGRCLTRFNPK